MRTAHRCVLPGEYLEHPTPSGQTKKTTQENTRAAGEPEVLLVELHD